MQLSSFINFTPVLKVLWNYFLISNVSLETFSRARRKPLTVTNVTYEPAALLAARVTTFQLISFRSQLKHLFLLWFNATLMENLQAVLRFIRSNNPAECLGIVTPLYCKKYRIVHKLSSKYVNNRRATRP